MTTTNIVKITINDAVNLLNLSKSYIRRKLHENNVNPIARRAIKLDIKFNSKIYNRRILYVNCYDKRAVFAVFNRPLRAAA